MTPYRCSVLQCNIVLKYQIMRTIKTQGTMDPLGVGQFLYNNSKFCIQIFAKWEVTSQWQLFKHAQDFGFLAKLCTHIRMGSGSNWLEIMSPSIFQPKTSTAYWYILDWQNCRASCTQFMTYSFYFNKCFMYKIQKQKCS